MSSTDSSAPLGILNVLSDFLPVLMKCLLSLLVPMLDVAPLSAAADGMDPLSIPRRSSSSSWLYVCTWAILNRCSELERAGLIRGLGGYCEGVAIGFGHLAIGYTTFPS